MGYFAACTRHVPSCHFEFCKDRGELPHAGLSTSHVFKYGEQDFPCKVPYRGVALSPNFYGFSGGRGRDIHYTIPETTLNILDFLVRELSLCQNGQFQKISIPNHGRLPCFNPPLPSEIPKCVTPPCPQNSIIVSPPSPSEFPVFLGSTFSILATPI